MASYRAVFEADDSSFTSTMRRMRQESDIMATEMVENANKVASATNQSVNKVLAESISLYERQRELRKSEERMKLDSSYQSRIANASSPLQKETLANEWIAADKRLAQEHRQDDLQTDILREILSALKESAVQEIVDDKSQAAKNAERIRSGDTAGMDARDEYRARVQASMKFSPIEEEGKRSMREMWEVAKGTMVGNMIYNAIGTVGRVAGSAIGSTDGEVAAAKLWGGIPMAGGALEAAATRNLELSERRDRLALSLNTRGANVGILRDMSDEDIAKEYGVKLGSDYKDKGKFDAAILAAVNAKKAGGSREDFDAAVKAAETAYSGGQDAVNSLARMKADNPMNWSYNAAGFDTNEFLTMSSRLLSELGSAGNLQGQTKSLIDITRGGGIEEGTALGVAGLLRQSGGGDLRSVMGQIVGELTGGGTTRANRDRSVADVVAMSQARYSEGFVDVDPVRMAKIKSAFQSQYGASSPLATSDSIMGMMSAMSRPKDDYQTGLNFQIYSAQMAREGKAASYVGFQKWQEKPENGLMQGVMDLSKQFGGGEMTTMFLKNLGIGRTWEASEALSGMDTTGLSQEAMSRRSPTTGFQAQATQRMEAQARLSDAYVQGMFEGMKEALSQTTDAITKNSRVLGEIMKLIKMLN